MNNILFSIKAEEKKLNRETRERIYDNLMTDMHSDVFDLYLENALLEYAIEHPIRAQELNITNKYGELL